MVQRLRVFISSPGDVREAREVAAQTVESVAQDYLRHFTLEPYLWDNEALLASGHFQDSIEPPSEFDIVTLILWSRLGTLLPIKTAVRSYVGLDGRSPVTGTEWEFEDALRSARARGVPDLLVYRSHRPAQVDSWNADRRKEELDQMAALDRFWSRHFADQGTLLGAYRQFEKIEQFASDLEHDLRRLLDRRVAALDPAPPHRLWPGSPFRGLEAFEIEHAPIFYGRSAETGRAVGQLIENAAAGRAFLLVSGASGSGKSSLVRAGVLPRLALPRRVPGQRFVRRVVFRPAEMHEGEDLFDALARVVVSSPRQGVGLPELGRPDRLAVLFREGPSQAPAFIETALDRLTTIGRKEGRILANEDATAVLFVDQLEDLFTDRVTPDHRQGFARLVAALARHGRIWVITTLRADQWQRVSDTPELLALCEGRGRFDLVPPGPAQLSQMIRLSAEAAGLEYEIKREDEITLGDLIAEEASQAPGNLPLLSYLLEQLYEMDVVIVGGHVLTYASHARLGGLAGSIATRAEAILNQQTPETRDALSSLLFRIVETTRNPEGLTGLAARPVPLADLEAGPVRRLATAFLATDARLLVVEGTLGTPVIRVAHEALFRKWDRARELLEGAAQMLAVRRVVEERYIRWSELGRRGEYLLSGFDLSDARRLLLSRRGDLGPDIISYVSLSNSVEIRRRQALQAILCSFAALTAALVVGGAGAGYLAQKVHTEAQMLDRGVVDDQRDGDDALRSGNLAAAITVYSKAVGEAEQTMRLEPGEPQWRFNLASAEAFLGYAYQRRGLVTDLISSKTAFLAADKALTDAGRLTTLTTRSKPLSRDIIALRAQLAPYIPH